MKTESKTFGFLMGVAFLGALAGIAVSVGCFLNWAFDTCPLR